MLDNKKVGTNISLIRKSIGLSQEKLADMLHFSPQAISRWENGHTLPETALLPMLAQIFECSIDDILSSAYLKDDKIDLEKPIVLKNQADYIADRIAKKVGKKEYVGLSDETIIESIAKSYFNVIFPIITREKETRTEGKIRTKIPISSQNKTFKLIEIIYHKRTEEFYNYCLINGQIKSIPKIYYIDYDKKLILFDDVYDECMNGYCFNENNENGEIFRDNYKTYLSAIAEFHSDFWEDEKKFAEKGLDWRHQTKENLFAHISQMERDLKNYRKKEEQGKIPSVWEFDDCKFVNHITTTQFDLFQKAIQFLKDEYIKLIDTRFIAGKNITIIHGDLHPGTTLLSKDDKVYFVGLQAVRIGLPTEDLAMFLALHIEPTREKALPLLDYYYKCLANKVKNYSYDDFMNDYKIAITENMFFTIRLINGGIYDFSMRDKAIKVFEDFVL